MNKDKNENEINEAIIDEHVAYYRFYLNLLRDIKNEITHTDNDILLSWYFHQGEMSIFSSDPTHWLGRIYYEKNRMCFEPYFNIHDQENEKKDTIFWSIEDRFKNEREKSLLLRDVVYYLRPSLNQIFNASSARRMAEHKLDDIVEERKNRNR